MVYEQAAAQFEAALSKLQLARPAMEAVIRTDMDQIITSKEHLASKIRGRQATCRACHRPLLSCWDQGLCWDPGLCWDQGLCGGPGRTASVSWISAHFSVMTQLVVLKKQKSNPSHFPPAPTPVSCFVAVISINPDLEDLARFPSRRVRFCASPMRHRLPPRVILADVSLTWW